MLLYHDGGKGRPRAQRILIDMNDTQRRLYDLFGLDRYALPADHSSITTRVV